MGRDQHPATQPQLSIRLQSACSRPPFPGMSHAACRKHDLYGSSRAEAARIDMLVSSAQRLFSSTPCALLPTHLLSCTARPWHSGASTRRQPCLRINAAVSGLRPAHHSKPPGLRRLCLQADGVEDLKRKYLALMYQVGGYYVVVVVVWVCGWVGGEWGGGGWGGVGGGWGVRGMGGLNTTNLLRCPGRRLRPRVCMPAMWGDGWVQTACP